MTPTALCLGSNASYQARKSRWTSLCN